MKRATIHRPLIAAGVIMLLVAVLTDPMLRSLLTSFDASAVGGYSASDTLGQIDFAGTPFYTTSAADNILNGRQFGNLNASQGNSVFDLVNHRLFISDYTNDRILVFNLDNANELQDRVADAVIGQTDSKTNVADTLANSLDGPLGLAYDGVGNRLFVADSAQNRVVVFDVATIGTREDAVNVLGQADFNPGSIAAALTQSGMDSPWRLAYDSAGERLFVSDLGNTRILVFDTTTIANGENAVNVIGQEDFVSTVSATDQDSFVSVDGVAHDGINNRLFVVDSNSNRVMVFDVAAVTDGENAVNVIGQEDFVSAGSATDQDSFQSPSAVEYDSINDRLFVNDYNNNRVMVFDVSAITDGEDAVNVIGQDDFVSSGEATTQDGFTAPDDVAINTDTGRLFVRDLSDNRITIFDVDPAVLIPNTPATDGPNAVDGLGHLDENDEPIYTISTNAPNPQGLNLAGGEGHVTLDPVNHRLFVSDSGNNRILVFNLDVNNALVDHTADFVLGQPDFHTGTFGTTQSTFLDPGGVAYDSAGNRLFVADGSNSRVLVFDVTTITNGENATNVLGQADFVSSGAATTQTGMDNPHSPAYDPTTQRLFVGDAGNSRVLVFDVTAITDGEPAINVLGKEDFVTPGANTTQDGLSGGGVALDVAGQRLFVGDANNNRVMIFDVIAITDGEDAINVLGQEDFVSAGSATTADGFNVALDVTYDATTDRIFVSDLVNNRIMVFDVAAITDGEDAVDVYGQADFVSGGSGTTQSSFNLPAGVAYDATSDTLYVGDQSNNRIMIFGAAATPTPTATPTPGGGGGGGTPPRGVGFVPERIVVNSDEPSTDSRNVLVTVYANFSNEFVGTVDVVLSNDPLFSTYIPFRYNVNNARIDSAGWPKTIAWDLCWGVPAIMCTPGPHRVHARFYVNTPVPQPALTPVPLFP